MSQNTEDKFLALNIEAAAKSTTTGFRVNHVLSRKENSSCHVFCRRFFICILLVAVVFLSSVIYAIYHYANTLPDTCHSKECLRSAAAFKQNMDLSVNPCDDFYSYVCGNWADDHPQPEDYKSYNWYYERQVKIYRNIRAQLETNISRSDPKPVAQAKTMYQACLNMAARKRDGFLVVADYLKEFGLPRVPTLLNHTKTSYRKFKFDWISSVAKIQRKLGMNVIVGFDVVTDFLDKYRNRLTLEYHYVPGDLEFPAYEWSKLKPSGHKRPAKPTDNDSDAEDDEDDENEADLNDVADAFMELVKGINPSIDTDEMHSKFSTLAEKFLDFVNELPDEPESDEEDPAYYSVQELQNITDSYIAPRKPYPIWQRYLDVLFADFPEAKPTEADKLQITKTNVDFLSKLVDTVSRQPPVLIELYVWGMVSTYLVSHDFNEIDTAQGCAANVHKLMGLAVSYAIADKNFLVESKPRIERMLHDIQSEFNEMVLETGWMDAYTKYATLEKSKAMEVLIGFPEWILDVEKLEKHYQGLQVSKNHMKNWVNALQFLAADKLRFWRERNEQIWDMDPTEVNAFYLQERNAINIPVAIIQYPFYYLGLEALNHGALGEILGHELTHGFDNAGRHFDKFGDKKRWWSNHTLKEYDVRADCFVQQYNGFYVPEAKDFINGSLTLGENIADNGGLREALRAYRTYVNQHGPEPLLPGFENFTHEQLFFISFGNQNCETISSFGVKEILEDEHSPSKFRVRGVLNNMEEFSEVFQCPLGSTMNPKHKCRIW